MSLKRLVEIVSPVFYQVSLEGLERVNDSIRGKGHFAKTLGFLEILKKYGIESHVMLTVHSGNYRDAIPLASKLNGLTDLYTFNRLTLEGRGALLEPIGINEFWRLLEEWLEISRKYSHVELKDNLFNRLLYEKGLSLSGGCTGFGCGAAFNFLVLLPNGAVHACRKFNSYLGDIFSQSFNEIYSSSIAKHYRTAPDACKSCKIYSVCRGCLGVTATHGLDPFKERDPYCLYGPIE